MANGVIYCSRCGAPNSALAKFCSNCGTTFAPEVPPPSPAEVTPRAQGPAQPPPPVPPITAGTPWTPVQPQPGIRYAGFWIRLLAFIIDFLILGLIVWPLAAIIAAAIGLAGGAVMMPTIGIHLVRAVVGSAFNLCIGWLYGAGLESSSKQATIGKMALGLKVTDEQGNRISFLRATARHFSKILSAMILFIGFFMIGFTQRKQGLHDIIAGTLVIRAL